MQLRALLVVAARGDAAGVSRLRAPPQRRLLVARAAGDGTTLVVVESPSKAREAGCLPSFALHPTDCAAHAPWHAQAKTISKYLGPSYVVLASYGHVRCAGPALRRFSRTRSAAAACVKRRSQPPRSLRA